MRRFLTIILLLSVLAGNGFSGQHSSAKKMSPALVDLISEVDTGNVINRGDLYGLKKNAANQIMVSLFLKKTGVFSLQGELAACGGFVGVDLDSFATVYVPLDRIEKFAGSGKISYLDVAPRAEMALDKSAVQIKADLAQAGAAPLTRTYLGDSVVIGIVDSGIDVAHADFKNADGSSRILYLWDQTVNGSTPSEFHYGTEWSKADIDANVCTEKDNGENLGHGTHVAGIAAGDGLANAKYTGIAPRADIVVVKTDFDFAHIIDGIRYVFNRANGKPAVVNLSLGTHQGPHDNSSLPSRMINQMVGTGNIVVAAASNEGSDNIHLHYQTDPNTVKGTKFTAVDNSSGFIGLDIWYPPEGVITFAIGGFDSGNNWITQTSWIGPGNRLSNFKFKSSATGKIYGLVTIDATDQNNASNHNRHVYIKVDNSNNTYDLSANAITWVLLTKGSGDFDGWLFDGNSSFTDFSDQLNGVLYVAGDSKSTVAIPGTATRVITVGAYTTKTNWIAADGKNYRVNAILNDRSFFSSIGPTRDGRIKPDISAPGFVIASTMSKDAGIPEVAPARVLPDQQHWVIQGTSMAAPHVTGAVALLLQQKGDRSPEELLSLLQDHAGQDEFTGATPNEYWGAGKLDVFAALSGTVSEVSDQRSNLLPNRWTLEQNYPNPFQIAGVDQQNFTVVRYSFPENVVSADFFIFDLLGREIVHRIIRPGDRQNGALVLWNGKNRNGQPVPAGVYFYQLKSSEITLTKKMLVIR